MEIFFRFKKEMKEKNKKGIDIRPAELKILALPLISGIFCLAIFFLLLIPKGKEVLVLERKSSGYQKGAG